MTEQLVAVQPVGGGLEQHQGADQADHLDTRRAAQRAGPAGQPDATEDVVRRQVRDDGQEERHQQQPDHQPVERQVEGVEAEVLAELRIGDPELSAMQEQLDTHPVALRDDAGQQADPRRYPEREQSQPRQHRGAITRHRVVGAVAGHEHRPRPEGDRQGGEHDAADGQADHHEGDQPGQQGGDENGPVAQFSEPQPVDVAVDQARPDQQQPDHGECTADHDPAARGQLRHSRGGPHPHVPRSLARLS